MPYSKEKGWHLATKNTKPSQFYEYSNKIADLVDAKPYKSTKNAKKGYIAVKTRNSAEKETSFAGFRSRVMENIPYKSPASTPDPNKAFADHKYKMWKKKRGLPD